MTREDPMLPAVIHDVPEYTWVQLAQAARSANVDRKAGDTCSLLKGGSVTVLGIDPQFGTLVRYSLPVGERAAGALCPDGALVFLPPGVVDHWPAQGEVRQATADEDNARQQAVARLLER